VSDCKAGIEKSRTIAFGKLADAGSSIAGLRFDEAAKMLEEVERWVIVDTHDDTGLRQRLDDLMLGRVERRGMRFQLDESVDLATVDPERMARQRTDVRTLLKSDLAPVAKSTVANRDHMFSVFVCVCFALKRTRVLVKSWSDLMRNATKN
jgi:hypothetical protein